MDASILKQIGLAGNEIRVYLAMLEEDENLASAIANKTRINRSLMYTILNNLINKGVVSYVIKENRKYFRATDPEKILSILKEKEAVIKKQEEEISRIIPQLRALKLPKREEFAIEIYKGPEGFKTVLDDVLRVGKDYQMIGYTGYGLKNVKYWFAHWHRRRIRMKIKRNVLFPYKFKGTIATKYPLTEARFLPKNYPVLISILTYGEKAIIFLPLEKDFAGIIIKSREIVESFRSQFNILWNLFK